MIRSIVTPLLLLSVLLIVATASAQPPDTSWTTTYQYEYSEYIFAVRSAVDEGFVACGTTQYGPGMRSSWIMRADNEGNEIWSLLEAGGISDASDYIEPTSDGGFINCGETWSYSPYNDWDGFVRKLSADGEVEWARTIGEDGSLDYAFCVREVEAGGYIATGRRGGDPFLWRLGPDGTHIWLRTYPYEFWQFINFVEPTADGGFLVAAEYAHEFTIARMNQQGHLLWRRSFHSPNDDAGQAYSVREDSDGNIYACGRVWNHPTTYMWYVLKIDASGNMIWDDLIDPTIYTDEARDLVLTPDGNIVVAGYIPSDDYHRYALLKYDPDGNILWETYLPGGAAFSMDQMRDGGYIMGGEYQPNLEPESIAFHLIKTEPEVEIQLQTWTPVIPETGGWLHYGAMVSNILVDPTPLDAWTVIVGPNGARFPQRQFPVTLQPGATWTRPRVNAFIPAAAPNGVYTYEIHIGDATSIPPGGPRGSRNMGLGSFTFIKGGE